MSIRCFVAYKIFSKILVHSLPGILSKILSADQGAIIPGHSILHNITLAQEIVHSINKKNTRGNVVLKIDMANAYDWVDC